MSFFNIKARGRYLIVGDEGTALIGIVADGRQVHASNRFTPGSTVENILEFGRKQGAKQALWLKIADVREIEVKLGNDVDADERRSAIEYAAASHAGAQPGFERVAFLEGKLHDFRSGVLVSQFDAAEVLEAARLSAAYKMKFLGVSNFKQLLLAEHFSNEENHNESFLCLLGSHGFAATPERNRLTVRSLPFGIPVEAGREDWKQKLQRRLAGLKHRNVTLYAPGADPVLAEEIREATGAESVTPADWKDALERAAVFFGDAGRRLISPAIPPPKPKDPKAAGTFIGLALLGSVAFAMLYLWGQNYMGIRTLERRLAENKKIEDTVKAEEAKLKKIQDDITAAQEINRLFVRKKHISREYMLVMNLLSRYPLEYTRINRIEERNTGITIGGETVWQPDLSRFFSHFENELSKRDLTLFSDGLKNLDGGRIEFQSHVARTGH